MLMKIYGWFVKTYLRDNFHMFTNMMIYVCFVVHWY